MSKTMRLLFLVLLSITLPLQASAAATITRLADNQAVTMQQLAAQAEAADLVMIGEVHDNSAHHDLQLAVIRSLHAKKLPMAIGLEVIQSDSQQQLDAWVGGKLSEEQFQPIFAKNWSYDWRLYREIFIFARDNKIPMIGLNVPKEIVKKVSRQGYQSLSDEEKKNLPPGTSCDLNNPHTALLRSSFKDVFKHVTNGRVFDYFCEAQTLRNSGMAMNIAQYLRKQPRTKVVALTGIWHAVKNAIPDQLERNGVKLGSMVIMPEINEFSGGKASFSVIDYLVVPAP